MKRSRSVALTLMVGTAALALAGCDGSPPASPTSDYAFKNTDQCVAAGLVREECVTNFEQALKSHVANAPRFPTEQECVAVVDSECEGAMFPNVDGTTTRAWVPRMDGFLFTKANEEWQSGSETQVASSGGSGGSSVSGGGSHSHFFYSTPLYGSRSQPGSHLDLASLKAHSPSKPSVRPYVRNYGVQVPSSYASNSSGGSRSSLLSSTSSPSPSMGNSRTTTVSRGVFSGGRGSSAGG